MNNIVKIVLGLNIAAGGAGIFFGITKSGKVDEMKQAKIEAEGKAQSSSAEARKLKKENEEALTTSSTKDGTISSLEAAKKSLEDSLTNKDLEIEKAREATLAAQAGKQSADLIAVQAQQTANQVPGLKGQIAAYENLGTPQDIKDRLDRLAKLEAATAPAPKKNMPKKTTAGEVGTIQNHDPQLDFYVINVGSDNGINKGDEFTIFRAGKAIGKIEIGRAQPTVSIAIYKKGFPKPPVPFKSGDKVMKIN